MKTKLRKNSRYVLTLAVALALGFSVGVSDLVFGQTDGTITPLPSPQQAANAERIVNLPDFTPIVKKYGDAIVRITDSSTKNCSRSPRVFQSISRKQSLFWFFPWPTELHAPGERGYQGTWLGFYHFP